MSGEIFINYRSVDARSYAILLYLSLSACFGADAVFLDTESIPVGTDFPEQLLHHIRHARVVLAVIGPNWLSPARSRRRRIRREDDWTFRELAEAFTWDIRVVPVLADNARLPTPRELPAHLAQLGRRQYRALRIRDFRTDLDRITNDLIGLDPQLARMSSQRRTDLGGRQWNLWRNTASIGRANQGADGMSYPPNPS